ncbi:hypothetical protein [Prescottella equi]|uniref:Uncharacterized protein n=1 Tax=Rhodococcus hoagii TaxID=43767 RepID=A0AAE4ZCY6_RHOHA|nr:hypothetical protein [Prescottella equi]
MRILEQLEQIEIRAKIARDSGILQQNLGKIEQVIKRVNSLAASLSNAATAYQELHPVDPTLQTLIPDIQTIVDALGSLATEVRVKSQFGAREEFTTGLGEAEKLMKSIEASLSQSWIGYQEQNPRPVVDRALLTIFKNSGLEVDHLIEQFDDASRDLDYMVDFRIPRSDFVQRYQTRLDALSAVSEGLTGVVPAPLASFFRQSDSPQGAPLATLTAEVVNFLTEHQIIDRYSIRGRR